VVFGVGGVCESIVGGRNGVSVKEIRIVERDKKIIREIDRWRVCQGRHIMYLAGFSGQRACDRRLRKLIDAGYITRKKVLYGVAGIYNNTSKAGLICNVSDYKNKLRIENLTHDIAVLDTAIYFNKNGRIPFEAMTTERELHMKDGFGVRKHRPDFVFTDYNQTVCVEVELTLKAKNRFESNIEDNFVKYDKQIWIVPDFDTKIAQILIDNQTNYPDIEIMKLSEVQISE